MRWAMPTIESVLFEFFNFLLDAIQLFKHKLEQLIGLGQIDIKIGYWIVEHTHTISPSHHC